MVTFPEGHVERLAEDLVVIYTTIGRDYVRVCSPHRWASNASHAREGLPVCPHCELGSEREGHERFANLQLRMMPQEARP